MELKVRLGREKIRVKITIRVSFVKQKGAIRVSFESNDEKPFMSTTWLGFEFDCPYLWLRGLRIRLVPFSHALKTVPRISLPYCGYDLISALNSMLHVLVDIFNDLHVVSCPLVESNVTLVGHVEP
ncbi:thiazole synthase, partial [Striga asiatica]